MATIKAIEDRTIHQIQSGQVIVDLCSVVKELVENSLDAGATSIDVRFKNQGLESIEVQDNGDGITPQNYETVALKHHTSKLSSYSDLSTLETFGFRGEALSSLCALSKFTITTCMATDAPKGTKLEFEISGKLKGTSLIAAQKGTTVSVENLFNNLPVRRRELERNIKREWNRVTSLLGQYACITTGVKMSVTQQVAKGKKATLFSTKGNPSTRENIVNVFGAKTFVTLLTLDLKLELEPTSGTSQRWSKQDKGLAKDVHIIGHISRPAHGEGRQTPDRQMFFVNGRPCALPQVSKTFNEVYKQFNSSQSPFIFANIEMDTHLYDVNVSPDKRTILLHDQSQMLEHLKTSLIQLFESQDHTVPISQFPARKQPSYTQLTISQPQNTPAPNKVSRPSNVSAVSTASNDDDNESKTPNQPPSRVQNPDSDEEESGPLGNASTRSGGAYRTSLNRDGDAVTLISDWLGKKTDDRIEPKESVSKPAREKAEGLSKEKRQLAERLVNESKQAEDSDEDLSDDQESSAEVAASTPQLPRKILDFNKQISGHKIHEKYSSERSEGQEPIPAIVSPPRRTISAVPTGTTAIRPLRTPATVATITIGDHTITSSIGSPSAKKARIEGRAHNAAGQASPVPSFGSRLSQRFAASGSTQQTASTDHSTDNTVDSAKSPLFLQNEPPNEVDSPETDVANDSADEVDESIAEKSVDIPMIDEDTVEKQTEAVDDEDELDDASSIAPESEVDGDYIDEEEKKAQEEAKVAEMIKLVEEEASRPSGDNTKRANSLLKGGTKRNDATVHLAQTIDVSLSKLESHVQKLREALQSYDTTKELAATEDEPLDSAGAEEKLSLTINKSDFASMKPIGQFNLGFILASRTSLTSSSQSISSDAPFSTDDLFIIDQHASDEKYNFERLQANTIVQSQRLVRPKTLDLTAIEEEIVKENLPALEQNGFIVTIDESGDYPVGQRCQLISLPLSRETTFSLSDLEELISLLVDHPGGTGGGPVPRPSKVRKMFAMRACRSSIMIGRTLTQKQMGTVVRHMGEIDKPWNCPHGRPTMRHLCGLGAWDEIGWREGDGRGAFGEQRVATDWSGYVKSKRKVST